MGSLIDYQPALTLIENHKRDLPFSVDQEKDAYVSRIQQAWGDLSRRTQEDSKAAVQIAVDGAKTLITIGGFAFGLFGLVIQYGFQHGIGWGPTACLILAELLLVISMMFGMNTIGLAFKRADGRTDPGSPPWSTTPLSPSLMWQSYLGLGSLAAFGLAISLWNPMTSTADTPIKSASEIQTLAVKVDGLRKTLSDLAAQIPSRQAVEQVIKSASDAQEAATTGGVQTGRLAQQFQDMRDELGSLAKLLGQFHLADSGLSRIDWQRLQRRMSILGYYSGAIDGYPGPKTHQAISMFQAKNAMPSDGEVTVAEILRILEQSVP